MQVVFLCILHIDNQLHAILVNQIIVLFLFKTNDNINFLHLYRMKLTDQPLDQRFPSTSKSPFGVSILIGTIRIPYPAARITAFFGQCFAISSLAFSVSSISVVKNPAPAALSPNGLPFPVKTHTAPPAHAGSGSGIAGSRSKYQILVCSCTSILSFS